LIVAVNIAVPLLTHEATPADEMVATLLFELVQAMVLLVGNPPTA